MSRGAILLYAVLPYVALAIFVVGHWWRYRTDQYGWGARSSQLLESRVLKWASVIFHLGALAAIGGHVLGMLVPVAWTDAVGIDAPAYHAISIVGGLGAGAAVTVGFLALVYRRVRFPRVRTVTTRMDVAVFGVLALGIGTGMWATLGNTLDEVLYRDTVAPWFRSLFVLDPRPELMTGGEVPFSFQLHVTLAWLLFAVWPFSRLVHAWSIPVDYLRRSPIVYRARTRRARRPQPAQASVARMEARR